MRRWLTAFLLGGVLGVLFGTGLGLFLFPYWFPPPAANEQLTAAEQTEVLATGEFIHADPNDPVHYGQGKVTVYDDLVFLHEDFEVGPGPDYHVFLVPETKIRTSEQVRSAKAIDLGRLRAFEGSQKYDVPGNVDLTAYPSVVIWCETFSVLISPADLTFATSAGADAKSAPGSDK